MIVAIHQPNFLPWLGFFSKAAKADVFVLLDDVPFTRRGYQNRVCVKGATGPHWLTVPVQSKGKYGQLTSEVLIDNSVRWADKILGTLRHDYARARFFRETINTVSPVLSSQRERLVDLTIPLIEVLLDILAIHVQVVRASDLGVAGTSSEHLAKLVAAVGGHTYLSGPSGKAYMDEAVFARAGIAVEYTSFVEPQYAQLHGDFAPGLSVIDALCTVGPAQTRAMLGR